VFYAEDAARLAWRVVSRSRIARSPVCVCSGTTGMLYIGHTDDFMFGAEDATRLAWHVVIWLLFARSPICVCSGATCMFNICHIAFLVF
jgi:hypothetical protein